MSLKKHPNWNAEDFAYLTGKGYKEHEIKAIWDRDAKRGHGPQTHKNKPKGGFGLAKPTGFSRYENVEQEIEDYLAEKKLTPAEKDKREEIAKAMERDNPNMPMDKKMAIATAQAKKVAEGYRNIMTTHEGEKFRSKLHATKKDADDHHWKMTKATDRRGKKIYKSIETVKEERSLEDQHAAHAQRRYHELTDKGMSHDRAIQDKKFVYHDRISRGLDKPQAAKDHEAWKEKTTAKRKGRSYHESVEVDEETSLQRAQRIIAESRYDQWGSARPGSTGDGASKGRGSRKHSRYDSYRDRMKAGANKLDRDLARKRGEGKQLELKLESFSQFMSEAVTVDKKDYSWGKMMTVKHGKSHQFPLHPEHQSALRNLKDGDKTSFKDETGSHIKAHRQGDTVHLKHPGSNKTTPVAYSHFAESVEIEEAQGTHFIVQHKTTGHSVQLRAKHGLDARERGAKELKVKPHEVDVVRRYPKESVEHIEEASDNHTKHRELWDAHVDRLFMNPSIKSKAKSKVSDLKKLIRSHQDRPTPKAATPIAQERQDKALAIIKKHGRLDEDYVEEEVAANAVSGGGVDMNTNGRAVKKRDRRTKWDFDQIFKRASGKYKK